MVVEWNAYILATPKMQDIWRVRVMSVRYGQSLVLAGVGYQEPGGIVDITQTNTPSCCSENGTTKHKHSVISTLRMNGVNQTTTHPTASAIGKVCTIFRAARIICNKCYSNGRPSPPSVLDDASNTRITIIATV